MQAFVEVETCADMTEDCSFLVVVVDKVYSAVVAVDVAVTHHHGTTVTEPVVGDTVEVEVAGSYYGLAAEGSYSWTVLGSPLPDHHGACS